MAPLTQHSRMSDDCPPVTLRPRGAARWSLLRWGREFPSSLLELLLSPGSKWRVEPRPGPRIAAGDPLTYLSGEESVPSSRLRIDRLVQHSWERVPALLTAHAYG